MLISVCYGGYFPILSISSLSLIGINSKSSYLLAQDGLGSHFHYPTVQFWSLRRFWICTCGWTWKSSEKRTENKEQSMKRKCQNTRKMAASSNYFHFSFTKRFFLVANLSLLAALHRGWKLPHMNTACPWNQSTVHGTLFQTKYSDFVLKNATLYFVQIQSFSNKNKHPLFSLIIYSLTGFSSCCQLASCLCMIKMNLLHGWEVKITFSFPVKKIHTTHFKLAKALNIIKNKHP